MTVCNDAWIINQCETFKMIEPFEKSQIRELEGHRIYSYGPSSYGYDIRLSPSRFLVAKFSGEIIDPKIQAPVFQDQFLVNTEHGQAFVLPGNSFALGVSVERFQMPPNVIAIATGKSSLARNGIQVNITPLEAFWTGFLTIEVINNGQDDILVYANEGIAQLVFFQGEPCLTTYGDRNGKYQDQPNVPVLSRL